MKNKNIFSEENDLQIRPQYLSQFVGQKSLISNLNVYLEAAKKRNDVLEHVLLVGPPGLGKTTIANIIAHEMGSKIHLVSAPNIEKPGELACIISSIEANDILFIDEIHRLPKCVEELLYSVMEDFQLVTLVGALDNINAIKIDIPPFTLIGATTRSGNLSAPFRARFGIVEEFTFYKDEDIEKIILRTSVLLKTPISNDAIKMIAARSRQTPRLANRIFRRVRDFADFNNKNLIDYDLALQAFKSIGIDKYGLNKVERDYLETIYKEFNGGPIGVKAIANIIFEDEYNIRDVYEPYLLKLGLITLTKRGRVITNKGISFINNKEFMYQ